MSFDIATYIALFEENRLDTGADMTDLIWNLCVTMIVDAKDSRIPFETLKATWVEAATALDLPVEALRMVLEDMTVNS